MFVSSKKMVSRLFLLAIPLMIVAVILAVSQVSASDTGGSRDISAATLEGIDLTGGFACFDPYKRKSYTLPVEQTATLRFQVDNANHTLTDGEHIEQVQIAFDYGWKWIAARGAAEDGFPFPQNPVFQGQGTDGFEITGLSVSEGHTWEFEIDVVIPVDFSWDPETSDPLEFDYQLEGNFEPGTGAPHFTAGKVSVKSCPMPDKIDATKMVDPLMGVFGEDLTYTIVVTNDNKSTAKDINVADTFPTEVTDVSCECETAPITPTVQPETFTVKESVEDIYYGADAEPVPTNTFKIVLGGAKVVPSIAQQIDGKITLTADTSDVPVGRPGDIDVVILTSPNNQVFNLGDLFDEEILPTQTVVIDIETLTDANGDLFDIKYYNGVWSLEIVESELGQDQGGPEGVDGKLDFAIEIDYRLPQEPTPCPDFDGALNGNVLDYTIAEIGALRKATLTCEATFVDLLTVEKWAMVDGKRVTDILHGADDDALSDPHQSDPQANPTFYISATNQTSGPIEITSVTDLIDFAVDQDQICSAISDGLVTSVSPPATFNLPGNLAAGHTVQFTCSTTTPFTANFTNNATVNTNYDFTNTATIKRTPDTFQPTATVSDMAGKAVMNGEVVADVVVDKVSSIVGDTAGAGSGLVNWGLGGEQINYTFTTTNEAPLDGTVKLMDTLPFRDDEMCLVSVFPAEPMTGTVSLVDDPDPLAVIPDYPSDSDSSPDPLIRTVSIPTTGSNAVPASALVTSVELTVALNHLFLGDLKIEVVSPKGTSLTVLNQAGLNGDNPGGGDSSGDDSNFVATSPITFADDGADGSAELIGSGIGGGGEAPSGRFSPARDGDPNSVATFAGFIDEDAHGEWKVIFTDLSTGVSGTFDELTLSVGWREGPVEEEITVAALSAGHEVTLEADSKIGDGDADGGYAVVSCTADVFAGVAVAKNPPEQTVIPGQQIEFTITVSNTGKLPMDRVEVEDARYFGCNYDSDNPNSPAYNDAPAFTSLAPGAAFSYSCTDITPSTDYTNTITGLGYFEKNGVLVNTANAQVLNAWPQRSDDDQGQTLTPVFAQAQASATVIVEEPNIGIEVSKTLGDNPGMAQGEAISYTISISNTGNVPATLTVNDDYLDSATGACLAYDSADGNPVNDAANSELTWSNVALGAGQTMDLMVTFSLVQTPDMLGCPNEVTVVATSAQVDDPVVETARFIPTPLAQTREVCVTLEQGDRSVGEALDWELRDPTSGDVLHSGSAVTNVTSNNGTAKGCFNIMAIPSHTYDLFIRGDQVVGDTLGRFVEDQTFMSESTDLSNIVMLEGDANHDNRVSLDDFSLLKTMFNTTGANLAADFNEDNVVNIEDFGLLGKNYNSVGATVRTVPANASRTAGTSTVTLRALTDVKEVSIGDNVAFAIDVSNPDGESITGYQFEIQLAAGSYITPAGFESGPELLLGERCTAVGENCAADAELALRTGFITAENAFKPALVPASSPNTAATATIGIISWKSAIACSASADETCEVAQIIAGDEDTVTDSTIYSVNSRAVLQFANCDQTSGVEPGTACAGPAGALSIQMSNISASGNMTLLVTFIIAATVMTLIAVTRTTVLKRS